MKGLEVIRIVGKLMLALVFILAENEMAVIPLIIYPVIMGISLVVRERVTIEANEETEIRQNHLVHTVNDAVNNFRLIADFQLRPFIVDTYEERIARFNQEEIVSQKVNTNNNYLAPWLTTLLVGLYMVFGCTQVKTLGGTVSLGTFLATINVFKEIGVELQEIYIE